MSEAPDADLEALAVWLARYGFPPAEATEARASVDSYNGRGFLLTPDRLLEGGETLSVGPYRFEIVWTPGHVALYAGDGMVIEARAAGMPVRYTEMWQNNPTFIRVT